MPNLTQISPGQNMNIFFRSAVFDNNSAFCIAHKTFGVSGIIISDHCCRHHSFETYQLTFLIFLLV